MIAIDDALNGAVLVRVETFDGDGQTIVRCELRGRGIERLRDMVELLDDRELELQVAAALARTKKKQAKGKG